MRSNLRSPLGVVVAAAAASLAMAGCGSDTTSTGAPSTTAASSTTQSTVAVNAGATVEITKVAGQFKYEPADKEIKLGEAVTWTNIDTAKHTVTANPDQAVEFKSPTMATDDVFVQTFDEAGTYKYFCSIHGEEKMSGTITVTE